MFILVSLLVTEHYSHLALVFLLLTLRRQMPTGEVYAERSQRYIEIFVKILNVVGGEGKYCRGPISMGSSESLCLCS